MKDEILINVFDIKDFEKWLKKNHKKEEKVKIILHKKWTGKKAPNHRAQIEIAICFGWIDTIIKRNDEKTFLRKFVKRKKNANWSKNTLSYAKRLFEEGKMSKQGIEAYERGLKKLPHDHNIPKNPTIPLELKKALEKNKKANVNFSLFSPSVKKMTYRWLLRAKISETRNKRVKKIVDLAKEKKKIF